MHTRLGHGAGACNQDGCVVNWGQHPTSVSGVPISQLYGTSSNATIDSRRPFVVSASFGFDGAMTIRLEQRQPEVERQPDGWNASSSSSSDAAGGVGRRTSSTHVVELFNDTSAGVPADDRDRALSALSEGMVLTASL